MGAQLCQVIQRTPNSPDQAFANESLKLLSSGDHADREIATKRYQAGQVAVSLSLKAFRLRKAYSELFVFGALASNAALVLAIALYVKDHYPFIYLGWVLLLTSAITLGVCWPFSVRLDKRKNTALEAIYLTPGTESLEALATMIFEPKGEWREPARLLARRVSNPTEHLSPAVQTAIAKFAGGCVAPLGGLLYSGAQDAAAAYLIALGERGSLQYCQPIEAAVARAQKSKSKLLVPEASAALRRLQSRSMQS